MENILEYIINRLNRIDNKIDFLIKKEKQMSNTLDEVLQDVQSESTVEDSLITLVQGIKSQLDAALSNTSISAADQAKIDAIFSGIESNKTKVSAAITANTPVTPSA